MTAIQRPSGRRGLDPQGGRCFSFRDALPSLDATTLRAALAHPLEHTDLDKLGRRYEGKVRDNYTTADGRRIIVATDRISAFDRILGTLPLKGQLLNHVAAWWFEKTRDVAKNHLLSVPDPNVQIVARMPAPAGRDGGARISHRDDLDQHLDALRQRRARVLRTPACRTACASTNGCPSRS